MTDAVNAFRTTTALNGDFITEMPKLTRVEVIDHSSTGHGRAWSKYDARDVAISIQDDGRTLKVFIR